MVELSDVQNKYVKRMMRANAIIIWRSAAQTAEGFAKDIASGALPNMSPEDTALALSGMFSAMADRLGDDDV